MTRRLNLFHHLQKSPDSSLSRQMIANANKYGLITGSYSSEHLNLTEDGISAVDEDTPLRDRASARVRLAIQSIPAFRQLYDRLQGSRLPAKSVMVDAIKEYGVPDELSDEAVDTVILNLRDVGLLQTLSGAERILSVDSALELILGGPADDAGVAILPAATAATALVTATQTAFETTCFYVTPIGEPGTEYRKHSDLFLESIVEPAVEQFRLTVVRADEIDKPGVITRQIIDYLLKSKLVVVDLSYHNPNVFYELAIRHAARLPVVQIMRMADPIPFDLNQIRTIRIDTTDIYSFVPRINTYRAELATQVRRALEDPDAIDNPITVYYPGLRMQLA